MYVDGPGIHLPGIGFRGNAGRKYLCTNRVFLLDVRSGPDPWVARRVEAAVSSCAYMFEWQLRQHKKARFCRAAHMCPSRGNYYFTYVRTTSVTDMVLQSTPRNTQQQHPQHCFCLRRWWVSMFAVAAPLLAHVNPPPPPPRPGASVFVTELFTPIILLPLSIALIVPDTMAHLRSTQNSAPSALTSFTKS